MLGEAAGLYAGDCGVHPGKAAFGTVLRNAGALDALLDEYVVAAPSAILQDRILSNGKTMIAQRRRIWIWWSGLGLAGAAFAGCVAGVIAATILTPSSEQEHSIFDANTTAFGQFQSPNAAIEEDL